MNHYERLKVSPDAPAEVIRAAYRALATKLHPDRQGGNSGPNEEAHEAMAALNASYLVLTNEKARHAYDAQLQMKLDGGFRPSSFQATNPGGTNNRGGGANAASSGAAQTVVPDIGWLKDAQAWSPRQTPIPNWAWALLVSALVTAAAMGWMVWHGKQSLDVDKLLTKASTPELGRVASGVVMTPGDVSAMLPNLDPMVAEQIAKVAADGRGVGAAADQALAEPMAAASGPQLSNDELDKLSTDELLARTQQLVGGQAPKASADVMGQAKPASAHLLDGVQGLSLKISPSTRMGSVPSSQP